MVVFNDDLLLEILCRLPAKSILRFKSVSKHWLSLLSNRYFTLMFDKLSVSPGIFYNDEYIPFDDDENQSTQPFRSLDFCNDIYGIKIVQSCNGLLLCCSNNVWERSRSCKYYVFNPTTKQFDVIPPFIGAGGHGVYANSRFMGLAFHHADCVHYKLVSVYPAKSIPDPDRRLYQVQIYSSHTAKWRILSQSFPFPSSFVFDFSMYGVYWNGAIYWDLLCDPFYFKLDVERLQSLPLPDYLPRTTYFFPHYLGESLGHLYLVGKPNRHHPSHLNVFEMLSDHSGWLFKYQVKLPHDAFEILDIVRGEKEEDTFMVGRIYEKIIRYNILGKTFKPIFNLNGKFRDTQKAHRYIETIGSF